MATKHRVILTLDADQLRYIRMGLTACVNLAHKTSEQAVEIKKVGLVISAALEVCENSDRADEAERTLSQLTTRSLTQ